MQWVSHKLSQNMNNTNNRAVIPDCPYCKFNLLDEYIYDTGEDYDSTKSKNRSTTSPL